MVISAFSPASIWNATTRSLTNMGSGALLLAPFANTVLAANAIVNFTPVVGRVAFTSLAVITIAAGGAQINLIDGTNTVTMVTVGASSTGFIADCVSVSTTGPISVGLSLKNTTATVGTYLAANMNWVQ